MAHRERLRCGTFSALARCPNMGNSSFAALVLIMLIVAVAVFVFAPHERRSTVSAGLPSALWSVQR